MTSAALARQGNILPLPVPAERDRAAARAQPQPRPQTGRDRRQLGQILLEDGAVTPAHLLKAVVMRQRQSARLGEILLAQGWVTEEALIRALSRQWRASPVDLIATPPDTRLIDMLGPDLCLRHGILPWRRIAGVTYIATAHPDAFEELQAILPPGMGATRMLLCPERQIHQAILATRQTALIRQAETSVPEPYSCRTRNETRAGRLAITGMALTALCLWIAPVAILSLLGIWAALTMFASVLLKLFAFLAALRENLDRKALGQAIADGRVAPPQMQEALPVISVMVPLFSESDIAGRLVARLSRLTYPRELTDLLLVIEESDTVTRDALRDAELPGWIRVITVPDGPIRTKPRALNYALNFCRGQIVGIWDAEDQPEPDQLHKIARRFHFAPADVACLQGVLDYYNPRSNWLARCFSIEYAAWFRAVLPGVARLGLVVPLGGTTLFFRRRILEEIGAWDAWNVTEDADLGVRLARHGYRTELVDTVTHEEANCRVLPWIRQRSRWLKGYAMTWGVHMRDPVALWHDLGPRRFIGFQVQFFASLSQYLLIPVLWSFWLMSLGLPHPLTDPLTALWDGWAISVLFILFIASEVINITVGLWAVRSSEHRHLMPWVPTQHFYFPLGCLAGWKAIYEVITKPFYWDKTAHGLFDTDTGTAPAELPNRIEPFALPAPSCFDATLETPRDSIATTPVTIIGQIG